MALQKEFSRLLSPQLKKDFTLGFSVSKEMIEDDKLYPGFLSRTNMLYSDDILTKPYENNMSRLSDVKNELQNKIGDVCTEVNKQQDMFEALRDFNYKVNENWNSLGVHQKNLIKSLMKEILDL